jgi:hypothetical protein
VYVVPSHQEGLCIAALEAMSCGVPMISTPCGGSEEFVLPERTGALVAFDAEAMASAIGRFVADRACRDGLGRNARQLILDRYVGGRIHPRPRHGSGFSTINQKFPRVSTLLVTGGAGFIGVNTALHFARQGWKVVVADNLSRRGTDDNLAWLKSQASVEFERCDIRDAASIADVIARHQPELLIHLAAQVAVTTSVTHPREDFEINALGTFNVLEGVRLHAPGRNRHQCVHEQGLRQARTPWRG